MNDGAGLGVNAGLHEPDNSVFGVGSALHVEIPEAALFFEPPGPFAGAAGDHMARFFVVLELIEQVGESWKEVHKAVVEVSLVVRHTPT